MSKFLKRCKELILTHPTVFKFQGLKMDSVYAHGANSLILTARVGSIEQGDFFNFLDLTCVPPGAEVGMHTHANDNQKKQLQLLFDSTADIESARDILMDLQIPRAASDRMELYKSRALSCLARLTSPDLKGLLRRVISKIFKEIDVMGCCNDYKAGHDQGRRQGEEPTG